MVPVLAAAGLRVVVPDLVGFGRSDKPTQRDDYTYQRHVDWMTAWLEAVDLRGVTLVGQDWGGLIGLRLVAEHPDRFDRVVVANTFLPTGDRPAGEAFLAWRKYSQEAPEFNAGRIVQGGSATRPLDPAVVAAYDAPFPDDRYKAGARQFPTLVPISPDDPAAAAEPRAWEVLERWDKPMLCAFSDGDAITAGADRIFLQRVPGTKGMPHTTIAGGGHFLQEDKGEDLAAAIVTLRAGDAEGGVVAPTDVVSGFLPSRNGFAFANDFPHVPAKTIDLVVTKVPLGDASNGLCGGMVYAALDLFVAQRLPDPAQVDRAREWPAVRLPRRPADRQLEGRRPQRLPGRRHLLPPDELDGARRGAPLDPLQPVAQPGLGDGQERVAEGAGRHRRRPPEPARAHPGADVGPDADRAPPPGARVGVLARRLPGDVAGVRPQPARR